MQQNSFDWKEKLKAFKIPILILATILIVTSCNTFMECSGSSYYLDILPKSLEALNVKEECGCFFAIYDLSPATINAINQQGLSFFKDPTKSRVSNLRKDIFNPYPTFDTYEAWQKTPIQVTYKSSVGDFGSGFRCLENRGNKRFFSSIDQSLLEKIELALHPKSISYAKNSFYTGNKNAKLVVIPSLGIYAKNSFYTGNRNAQLVVLPSLGIAVISGDHGFLFN